MTAHMEEILQLRGKDTIALNKDAQINSQTFLVQTPCGPDLESAGHLILDRETQTGGHIKVLAPIAADTSSNRCVRPSAAAQPSNGWQSWTIWCSRQ